MQSCRGYERTTAYSRRSSVYSIHTHNSTTTDSPTAVVAAVLLQLTAAAAVQHQNPCLDKNSIYLLLIAGIVPGTGSSFVCPYRMNVLTSHQDDVCKMRATYYLAVAVVVAAAAAVYVLLLLLAAWCSQGAAELAVLLPLCITTSGACAKRVINENKYRSKHRKPIEYCRGCLIVR